MDGLLIALGIMGVVLSFFMMFDANIAAKTTIKSFVVSLVLLVLGSWIDNWFMEVKLIEHQDVSSLPVDGGQLEFFKPVDVLETQHVSPWFLTGGIKSTFEVKETK